ncbi:MAG: hypothetical protein HUU23_12795 [Caldilineales bacterium]|nr:hypothetical protein [Caldilineales bacterium]
MSEEQQTKRSPVVEELNELGKKLGDALRTLLDSPQRREIEEDVREGLQTVVSEINEALAKARSTEVGRDVEEQAGKVVDAVRASKVTEEARAGFLKGLQTLNTELDKVVERLQTKAEPAGPPEAAPEPAPEPEAPAAES